MDFFDAVVLGIVEGLTEFFPISSTGHMILASSMLGLPQDEFLKTFEIAIQFGSILAVLFLFYPRLLQGVDIWIKLCIGFVPTGICGLFLYKYIKQLFDGYVVAIMLIAGGIAFLLIEYWHKNKVHQTNEVTQISYKQAFLIGLMQCLAMIPGTSRSGATIIGGLLLGLNRRVAAEFSFLLALPTMFAATGYDVYKNLHILDNTNVSILLIGGVVAFLCAIVAIKVFLAFVSRFSYVPFGIYRICIGALFLVLFAGGVFDAHSELFVD
ncbi:undecaprenyl-diphosphate phosphatase [Helicobacter equorum]|uniref:undecaprenyl-diphosphate phosphatase n=1 Tax=Helicobacter equorum TaxID=361872 RepID=UPI000CF12F3F|nr:undecaprenyl-diphosphate phosphatase [Helicobacter equorum]